MKIFLIIIFVLLNLQGSALSKIVKSIHDAKYQIPEKYTVVTNYNFDDVIDILEKENLGDMKAFKKLMSQSNLNNNIEYIFNFASNDEEFIGDNINIISQNLGKDGANLKLDKSTMRAICQMSEDYMSQIWGQKINFSECKKTNLIPRGTKGWYILTKGIVESDIYQYQFIYKDGLQIVVTLTCNPKSCKKWTSDLQSLVMSFKRN